MQGQQRLRMQITGNTNELNEYNRKFQWVPSAKQIHPTDKIREEKVQFMSFLESLRWKSNSDFILYYVFQSKISINRNGFVIAALPARDESKFVPNLFPYNVPEGTQHYVFWYFECKHSWTIEEIQENIESNILDLLKSSTDYDFVWYQNPKPSVHDNPQLHHVQVFWTWR